MDTQTEIPSSFGPELITWSATERIQHRRGKTWYAVAVSTALVMLAYSIWTAAWSFTLVLVLGCIVYYLTHRADAATVSLRVFEEGFVINDSEFVPWHDCKGYWVSPAGTQAVFHIVPIHDGRAGLQILSGKQPINTIRKIFSSHMTELTDRHETVLDKIARYCKL